MLSLSVIMLKDRRMDPEGHWTPLTSEDRSCHVDGTEPGLWLRWRASPTHQAPSLGPSVSSQHSGPFDLVSGRSTVLWGKKIVIIGT